MKIDEVKIENDYSYYDWYGKVTNNSNYSFTFPKIFACIFKDGKMMDMNYTYLDTDCQTPRTIIISSVSINPTESECIYLKNCMDQDVYISGWTLGDKDNPTALKFPAGTKIVSDSYLTIKYPLIGFEIDDTDESIYLKDDKGILVDTWDEKEESYRMHENATCCFDSYLDLPDNYDEIKYYLSYARYSLEGTENIKPNWPQFTELSYTGVTRKDMSFEAFLLDHENERNKVLVDWGDNSTSEWSQNFYSGTVAQLSHIYEKPGVYYLKAKAKDQEETESTWTESLKVDILSDTKLTILTDTLKTAVYKKYYDDTIKVIGGLPPYHWESIGLLPKELKFDPLKGRIFGIPISSGNYLHEFRLKDSGNPPAPLVVKYKLLIVNHPPKILSPVLIQIQEHQKLAYTVNGEDPDGNELVFEFKNLPSWLKPTAAIVIGTPPESAPDTSFTVIATDGELSDTLTVKVDVISVNDPPKIQNLVNISFTNTEEHIINLDNCVADPDDEPGSLIWQIKTVNANAYFIIKIENRTVRFSAPGWTGAESVEFKVTDAAGASDTIIIQVEVKGPSFVENSDTRLIPDSYCLKQNYPNPFNPQTTIVFGLPEATEVSIAIYNVNGQLVAELFNGRKAAGFHQVTWDAANASAGIYLIKMQTETFVEIRKCLLIK